MLYQFNNDFEIHFPDLSTEIKEYLSTCIDYQVRELSFFYQEGGRLVVGGGDQNFLGGQGGGRITYPKGGGPEKMATTGNHKQTAPLSVKNDSSLINQWPCVCLLCLYLKCIINILAITDDVVKGIKKNKLYASLPSHFLTNRISINELKTFPPYHEDNEIMS